MTAYSTATSTNCARTAIELHSHNLCNQLLSKGRNLNPPRSRNLHRATCYFSPSAMGFPSSDRDDGHTLFSGPAISKASTFYIAFVTTYTFSLVISIYVAWKRFTQTRAVRIRGFLITACAILAIHVYLAALFVVYPLNDYFTCGTEFWIMNTIFPLGIAIFQASNVRLMAYAKRQDSMLDMECFAEKKIPLRHSIMAPRKWFKSADSVRRTYACISMGLLIQVRQSCLGLPVRQRLRRAASCCFCSLLRIAAIQSDDRHFRSTRRSCNLPTWL